MKPLRDTVRRTLYVVIVVLALLALLGAFLDNAYNQQKFQMPLLATLVILLIFAITLFIHTELSYRSLKAAEAAAAPAGAETIPEAPPAEAESEWQVEEEEAPAPMVTPAPAPVAQDWTNAVKTRIVCNNCHSYFQLDIPPARPQIVDCPSCKSRVILREGPGRQDPPRTIPCRSCQTLNEVIDVPDLAAFVCIGCGASNPVQETVTRRAKASARKPRRKVPARKGRGKKS